MTDRPDVSKTRQIIGGFSDLRLMLRRLSTLADFADGADFFLCGCMLITDKPCGFQKPVRFNFSEPDSRHAGNKNPAF